MKRIIFVIAFLGGFLAFSQTPGDIYQAATPATNPMDPDGDGFVSVNGTGYTAAQEDNELDFVAIPQVNGEPDNDTRTGGSCGATDVVDDPATGASASYVFFDDVNDVLIYRVRLGKDATGAFSFSVLIDSDGKFGFTGSTPDPNAVTGNPGFEYEIRFATGTGIRVDDVDGSTSANSTISTYTEAEATQRAYARFQDPDCSGDPVFYDFFIPISDVSVGPSTSIRLAAATSSSPANSVLSNISDIAGVDDDSFPDSDDAWESLIALQGSGTPVDNLGSGGCFLSGTSDTPTISSPIYDSNTSINGNSTEPDGAFVSAFTNGDTLGITTTLTSNRWTVAFAQGDLRPFDQITAIARDSCENASATSAIADVINDLDSDNDGVPDSQEGNGVDPGADADGDDIPNYLDTNYPDFVDSNNDGVNDNFDPDLDGIPNHLDVDSDGDGFFDNQAAGGSSLDADNDGIIDSMEDADGDGIPDSADVDFTGGTDADNDGIDDSVQGGTDTDGDGIQDSDDPDNDNDGLSDTIDATEGGTALTVIDTDGDGILDHLDADADGDGIPNITEGTADADDDGIPNFQDIDADGDGILDNIEAMSAASYAAPSGTDTDGDGIDDAYDADCAPCGAITGISLLTPINTDGDGVADYLDVDSDGDGIGDYTEGNDANLSGVSDVVDVLITGGADVDMDGIDDTFDSSIAACTDSYNANDGSATADGICDSVQAGSGTAIDTDGDGWADIYDSDNGGTAPALQDSDGDGIPNYQDDDDDGDGTLTSVEGTGFTQGGAPIPDYLYNPDYDGDGIVDSVDLDSDNDGILDADEDGGTGFDPTGDADGDGVLNYLDSSDITAGFPAFIDSNNDGINDAYDTDLDGNPDFHDLDSDGDGIVDLIEAGGTDADGNGIVDGFTDGNSDGIDDTIGVGGLTTLDSDGDGVPNNRDIDSDNDGLTDNIEAQSGASYVAPTGNDTDGDGIDDAYDIDAGGTAIDPVNTDGDGLDDYIDPDSDGDGIGDFTEGNDSNLNGISDAVDVTITGGTDADGDGVDDAFDALVFVPTGCTDTYNANDGSASADGICDNVQDGTATDTDGDGLPDVYDTDNGGTPAANLDSDGDGIPNFQDDDDDGDGILTSTEGTGFTQGGGSIPDYLYNPDSDGDGITDANDLDSDNDGIPDEDEDGGTGFDPTGDADGDGTLNYLDTSDITIGFPAFVDANGDGVNDAYDADLDGIPDFRDLDSDNDGVYDIIEAGGTDANNDGRIDSFTDVNMDGYDDVLAITPLSNPDSDGDGVDDAIDRDSDNDGIPDIIENGGTDANGDGLVDNSTDTDRDGIVDIYDTDNGGTPASDIDTDGDGVPDKRDRDSDGDGIADIIEAGGTDADNDGVLDDTTDTDGDGFADLIDPDNGGAALSTPDTDGDGIGDYQDADSDGDGITDNVEAQTDAGFTAPNGTSDANGFDTAYSGAGLDPVDTDNDGTPDFEDTDSDNDSISDAIEGNDANADGVANSSPSGTDTDGDGIDDTFDPDNGGTALTPQNTDVAVSAPSTADTIPDYRDTDDDGDGIATVDEPLDINPVNGTPNYLENSVGGCGIGFVTTDFSGSADGVFTNSGATNPGNSTGGNDGAGASMDFGDFMILDLTDEIPQGNSLNVRYRSEKNNDAVSITITSSLTSGGTYSDAQVLSNPDNTYLTQAYTVNTSGGIRYLRIEVTAQDHPNADANLDAITYNFQQCDQDTDLDGVADVNDGDSDNDGIPDITEGLGDDPSGDADGDGTLNYLDTDYVHSTEGAFVDTNGDLVNDVFDFDLDGIPNHMDLDSDSDGLPDAVEANDGTLPASMNDQGRYTIAFVQANDFDGDGHANPVDPDFASATPLPTSDTDLDGSDDYLDIDSDGDGNNDFIEAFDDDASGDALNDLLARAASYEGFTGNNYYLTTDSNGIDDGDGIPDWLEDGDSDGTPNYLDPGSSFYHDTDGDGLIDLFDSSSSGVAYVSPGPDSDGNGTPDYLQSGLAVTLPVTYLFINTEVTNGNVIINWATVTELNNSHFIVERSEDGYLFYTIGTVLGNGTSTERHDYNFTDHNPNSGVEYYRLIQEDFDGTQAISDILVVNINTISRNSLDIYPNPAKRVVNVLINGSAPESVIIVDISGRVTASFKSNGNKEMVLPKLESGLYFIRASGVDGKTLTGRLVIE